MSLITYRWNRKDGGIGNGSFFTAFRFRLPLVLLAFGAGERVGGFRGPFMTASFTHARFHKGSLADHHNHVKIFFLQKMDCEKDLTKEKR